MDLRELYQEVILDHGKNPRNHRLVEPYNREGRGYNPLCGDRITLRLQLDGDRITDIGFQGQGCAISQASCSTMTEAIKGKTLKEAEALFEQFHALVTGEGEADFDELDKLAVFAGVSEFPMRVKCATLGWHTLKHAVEGDGIEAVTE
jgi:nitrogen fixation NifU-like protein